MAPRGFFDRLRDRVKQRRDRSSITLEDQDSLCGRVGRQAESSSAPWPPLLPIALRMHLLTNAADYQLQHGMTIKDNVAPMFALQRVPGTYPIGTSLLPTPLPRRLFEQAFRLQGSWSELYANVITRSSNQGFGGPLHKMTKELREVDRLACLLPLLLEESNSRRQDLRGGPQDSIWDGSGYPDMERLQDLGSGEDEVEMAIWRSDYMIQQDNDSQLSLKQVEFNTIACAGGIHSNRASDMHRYFAKTSIYGAVNDCLQKDSEEDEPLISLDSMPPNETIFQITAALAKAHNHYTSHIASRDATNSNVTAQTRNPTCILMIVQPDNINIADERPIEYALWDLSPAVPCFRIEFGAEVLDCTTLSPNGALHYTPPFSPTPTRVYEVSVVYYRAGHELHEYGPVGTRRNDASVAELRAFTDAEEQEAYLTSPGSQCRVRLETSRAIKCPSILGHIATFKHVQAQLLQPGFVEANLPERGITRDVAKLEELREMGVDIFVASDVRADATLGAPNVNGGTGTGTGTGGTVDPQACDDWILKPARDGGGHNIFGANIPAAVQGLSRHERGKYVLMRRIHPPKPGIGGILMSKHGLYEGGTISELRIWGSCMWNRRSGQIVSLSSKSEGEGAGWSLKTKKQDQDEMSVVKGYGCFDSPLLVKDDLFLKLGRPGLSS